jgi:chromosome segregation ATPase
MLGVCLIAKSALEDAAGRQVAETALSNSEALTEQTQNELTAFKRTLANLQANESLNAALISSFNAKIAEQASELEGLTRIEKDLNGKLHKANELENQIEGTCAQFREVITNLEAENKKLLQENTALKNKPVEPLKPESKKSMFSLGGSARK